MKAFLHRYSIRFARRFKPAFLTAVVLFLLALATCAPAPQPLPTDDPALRRSSEALAMSIAERRDLSGQAVQYYRAEQWDTEVYAPRETADPMTVVDWGPEGAIPVEISRPVVYVGFSQPVTPLQALGAGQSRAAQMEISPEISGRFRWLGSRTLSFEPDQPITGARTFTVTVPAGVESLAGKRLGQDFSFSFSSPELDIIDFFPGTPQEGYLDDPNDVPPDLARTITVVFNHEPDLTEVAKHLGLFVGGREAGFRIERPTGREPDPGTNRAPAHGAAMLRRTLLVVPDQPLPENSRITLRLAAGARAAADQTGRTTETIREFHTLLPFEPVERMDPVWGFPRETGPDQRAIYLAFSHPVDPAGVAANLSIDLQVDDLGAHVEVWDRYIRLNGLPVEYESSYVVTLGAGLADVHGRSLGKALTVSVLVPPRPRFWRLPEGGPRMLEAQYPPTIIWEHTNLESGLYQIERAVDPYERIPSSRLRPYDFSHAVRNERTFEQIDLRPWLSENGTGFVRIAWNLGEPDASGRPQGWWQEDLMLQVTDLGITTRIGYNRALIWVHSLSSGKPVSQAAVLLIDGNLRSHRQTVTTTDGLAVIDLAPGEYRRLFVQNNRDTMRILVEHRGDKAMLRPNWSHDPYRHGVWNVASPDQIGDGQREPLVFTDRGLYRPGEEVSLRGIDRYWQEGRYRVYTGPYRLTVVDQGRGEHTIATFSGTTSSQGGFSARFTVPPDAAPGYYRIDYERAGQTHLTFFQVAFFRAAAFAVTLVPDEPRFFRGGTVSMHAQASYLSGGPVADGEASVGWFRQPVSIDLSAPVFDGYLFGPSPHYHFQLLRSDTVTLDETGGIGLAFDTANEPQSHTPADPLDPGGILDHEGEAIAALQAGAAYRYEAEIRVQDAALQEIAARSAVVVYPTRQVIGLRLAVPGRDTNSVFARFFETGSGINAELVLAEITSETIAALALNAEVELIHHSWRVSQQRGIGGRIRTHYEPATETVWAGTTRLSAGRGSVIVTPAVSGSYTVRVTARDGAGGLMVSEAPFYATGAEWVRWAGDEPDAISIIPDKTGYRPAETARLLVQSPIPRGRYLLTIEREGILDHRLIEMDGSANVIEVPITANHVPVIYVAISSHRERTAEPTAYLETDLGKPGGYFGIVAIEVNPEQHLLDIDVGFDKQTYLPGELATVRLRVTRAGNPVSGAEVTFLAADRGVLDLINHRIPDPLAFFYSPWRFPLGVIGADSRTMLIDPVTFDITTLRGGDAGKNGDDTANLRFDFDPLAVFEPAIVTDPRGMATVRFVFPDNLTTYRATAVAIADNNFGITEEEITVTQPIAVRLVMPQRLRVRDSSQAGVVMTNTSGGAQRVTVTARTTGTTVELHGADRQTVTVPPGGSTAVRFAIAARHAGEAGLRFEIQSDIVSETVVGSIPVDQPTVSEAITVTGVATQSAGETVVIPSLVPDRSGSLDIRTGTTRAGDIVPAINRLIDTRVDLLDQNIDRMLPALLFGENLPSVMPELSYDPGAISARIAAISAQQNPDGGFPFTGRPEGRHSSPLVSIRFAHLLQLADAADIRVPGAEPDGTTRNALDRYLLGIANTERMHRFTRAYSLWILSERGVPVAAQRAALARDAERIGSSELALIALGEFAAAAHGRTDLARADRLTRVLTNRIRVETRTIDLVEPFGERFFFDSQVTSLALLQMVQLRAGAHPDMHARIANTLSGRRVSGYWTGGHDTAWAVIAQAELMKHEGAVDADLMVDVTLAEQSLFSYQARGAGATMGDRFSFTDSPLAELPRNHPLALRFDAAGSGNLYYSATLRYALPQEVLLARDEGLSVVREIVDLAGRAVNPEELVAGRTYRMRVILSSPARHTMVELRVPVPSGAEILDQSFATSGGYLDAGGVVSDRWERETAFGDTEAVLVQGTVETGFLGARFTAFQPIRTIYPGEMTIVYPDLGAGGRSIEFLFRTITPGIYPTPPAVAHAIYTPEVFGRSRGELARIGERR